MNIEDKEPENQETQSDLDMDAAQAEISSELFGQGGDEEKVEPTEGEEEESSEGDNKTDDAATPSPQQTEEGGDQAAAGEENSEEVQAIGAPKTWNKEELATWATVPPEIQAKLTPILERREQDFLNGITQYKSMAERGQAYENVVAPYAPVMAAENLDPVQLLQSFAANHYLLSRGSDKEKVELAAALFNGYKIPLVDFLNHFAETGGAQPAEDPKYTALRTELDQLKTGLSTAQQRDQEATILERRKEIDAFAADPAHPYFEEVADDIRKIFEAKLATSLNEAYEKAIYANPTTRQKEIDRITAEKTSQISAEKGKRKEKVASSTADQVRTTPKSRDGTVPQGSMDDTLRETLAAIESRG